MKIVIDLQAVQSVSRLHGIGRYSLSFTKALVRQASHHEVWLVLNESFPNTIDELRNIFQDLIPFDRIKIFYSNQPTAGYLNNTSNINLSKKLREHFINTLSPDIVHISSLFEGWVDGAITSISELGFKPLTSVTLYDLIPLIHKKEYLKDINISKFYYKKLQDLKRADLLFAISTSSRQEAIDMLSINPDRIINCSAGISEKFRIRKVNTKDRLEINKHYGITRQFILYVGGFDYRKNTEKLIEAFSILPKSLREQHQLVLVGRTIEASERHIDFLKNRYRLKNDELIVTHFIPDYHLINLYNLCKLFILPSLHEGFGLPLLEALACGAVAIASNLTSLPELINFNDALFDPTETFSIKEKMITALTNESFREFSKLTGKQQSKKFTWDACAKKALIAIEELKNKKKEKLYTSSYKKIKMAYVSPLPPEKTGVSNYSLQLLPELASFFDIVIIVDKIITEDKWLISNFQIEDAQWFTKNAKQFDVILYQFGNSPLHYYMFKLFEQFSGIVVLHDFFLSGILHWADVLIPNEKNSFFKRLYDSHGYISLLYHKQKGREAALQTYPCNFSILKKANGIIVHSQHAIDLAKKWYNFDNPNYIQKIPQLRIRAGNLINRAKAREILQLTDKDFLICSFGFVSPNKLSDRICHSFINSKFAKNPNFYLSLVGENHIGSFGDKITELLKINKLMKIEITNFVPMDLFETYLSAADLAIQLRTQSRGETSACIYNCLDYGIPTIVNKHGSFNDLPENVVLKISENFSDSELVSAINILQKNKYLRKELAKNAFNYIQQHHPSYVANKYKKVICHFEKNNPNFTEQALIDNLVQNNFNDLDSENLLFTIKTIAANRLPLGLKQILVDISILINADEKTGIQRVVRAILIELLCNPPSDFRIEPIYFQNGQFYYAHNYVTKILDLEKNILEDCLLEVNSGDIFLGLDFCPMTIPQAKDTLQKWRIKGVRLYFILYDLLPIFRSEFFPAQAKSTFLVWLETITQLSHGIVTISKHVTTELSLWIKTTSRSNNPKISFFHLGSDIESSIPSAGRFKNNQIIQSISSQISFLTIGRIEPRKNHLQILKAFEQLWKNQFNINLIIVGQQGWMVEPLIHSIQNHSENGNRLFWFNNISDETLKDLYLASTALILASEDEGFGLPLIEAAHYGLNIIARDIPIFREIAGNNAFYFSGSEPFKLAHAIETWLTLRSKGMEPKVKGLNYLSWKDSTQQLLDEIIINKDSQKNSCYKLTTEVI